MPRNLASAVATFIAFFALFLSTTAARADGEPTFRYDFGVGLLGGSAQSNAVSAMSLAPALRLDLGAQLGDRAAILARVEAGTILVASEGAAYFLAEWTLVPEASIGTGIGYDSMSTVWVGGCSSVGPCVQNSWSGVSVPLVLAFDLEPRPPASGADEKRPGTLRLELEGAGGYDPRTETAGVHFYVGLGWTWR